MRTQQDALITPSRIMSGRIEFSIASGLWLRVDIYRDGAWCVRLPLTLPAPRPILLRLSKTSPRASAACKDPRHEPFRRADL